MIFKKLLPLTQISTHLNPHATYFSEWLLLILGHYRLPGPNWQYEKISLCAEPIPARRGSRCTAPSSWGSSTRASFHSRDWIRIGRGYCHRHPNAWFSKKHIPCSNWCSGDRSLSFYLDTSWPSNPHRTALNTYRPEHFNRLSCQTSTTQQFWAFNSKQNWRGPKSSISRNLARG